MNKKGFTLIELLAVIVILAIIALIVTPVISDIITSARHAANQRSVGGHIKNIEYAIIHKGFELGTGDLTKYDGEKNDAIIRASLELPPNDYIYCDSVIIENGIVTKAIACIDIIKGWTNAYNYDAE